jgi:hypothetical protein
MLRRGHNYLFLVVDQFNKMHGLILCKNSISRHEATKFFFANVRVHFGFPSSIVFGRDSIFCTSFGQPCGK